MELKLVINDGKAGKSYAKKLDENTLTGRKIGEDIDGNLIGLKDYKLKITGGSDSSGFPMRHDIQGAARKPLLASKSVGFKQKQKGLRLRKTVAGNTISDTTAQVNLKVITPGSEKLEDLFPKKEATHGS